ncbi:unnamed protein product [Amaranthus hypochondriacus]
MKIQCDVCSKKEASVFCSADEAALCDGCDHKVHHANKLASKHQRFSFLLPSPSHTPICDICQEKRALLFCQQDRAILCRECDIPLHTANEYTQKHNRFLLTGIKLSAMNSDQIKKNISNGCESKSDPVPDLKSTKRSIADCSDKTPNSAAESVVTNSSNSTFSSSNNISEYLIDMLPGWHFDDLVFDAATPLPFGFTNKGINNHEFALNEDVLSFFDVENNKELTSSAQSESFWVPEAAPATAASNNLMGHLCSSLEHNTNGLVLNHGTIQQQLQEETCVTNNKLNRKYLKDDVFTVPQITFSLGSNKRTRPFW